MFWTLKNVSVLSLQRRFPDFSYITQNGRLTDFLDCVIIRFVALIVRCHLYLFR